jgi:hypothetical protein
LEIWEIHKCHKVINHLSFPWSHNIMLIFQLWSLIMSLHYNWTCNTQYFIQLFLNIWLKLCPYSNWVIFCSLTVQVLKSFIYYIPGCKNFLKLCKTKYYNFSLFHTIQVRINIYMLVEKFTWKVFWFFWWLECNYFWQCHWNCKPMFH